LSPAQATELWCSRHPLPTLERELLRHDGSRVPVELRLSRIEVQEQPYMLGIARDLTERKRTEQALRESEANFRGVFENLVDVFYRTDRHGTIKLISPSVERYGHRVDNLLGKHVSEFSD